jgi:hypothetical protein
MTGSLDPWRTLGLPPGSSLDEIRRAYRRLAKANHPDAAGEAALPRFLAIQSAYEALAASKRGRRPGARPGSASTDDARRADRAGARPSAGTTGSRRPAAGSRPGAPGGPRGAGAPGGATSADRPAAADGSPGRRPKTGRTDDAGTTRRGGGRRRPSNRATPGSTSYDAADEEPFEPGWTGATWYGASSGTYWTINPKEYADPRKHGPEYQRRARRSASGGWIVDDEDGTGAGVGEPPEDAAAAPGPRGPSESAADGPAAPAPVTAASRGSPSRASRGLGREPDPGGASPAASRRSGWTSGGREPGEHAQPIRDRGGFAAGPPPRGPLPDPSTARSLADDGGVAPLLRTPTTPAGRLGLALLGWPPLGVAAATAIGESTGCGRFSASCAEVFSPGTWIVQIAIIFLLLALPRLAGWSAVGTLVALAAAVPTAVVLSASGGSNAPEASAGLLAAVLGVAYAAGVGWAIVHRWLPSAAARRVR